MAQIPSQRQREVSLEVALPMQAGLCMRSHKSDCSCGAAERSKGSSIRRLNGRHGPCWRQSPSSLSLLEKQELKPGQVENKTVVLVLLKVVPSEWAEWGRRPPRALARPDGPLGCSGSEQMQVVGRGRA